MFEWDEKKNAEIWEEREITFEQIVFAIRSGGLLDILDHPNQEKYPGQKLLIVKINDYIWVVPAERRGNRLRLITAYPSRKYTKRYLREKK
ncbi:hypothetical protein GFV12_08500 (plasmid) [Desulfurobacterium thermolithotrophum]|uniref:BrnT family toxin n=1 Tax=Desulfurobacterium thermolithotrophum TaxID=64160 RepID=UPI0013D0B892|nr:BrnT family toxin [Desulfurobacterium thermolithotrophum]